ncbi:EAL and GGDEF domain-containing protein [Orenia marismortui]|uniref:PAS domain S-box-containing protein/diguanylate cyclase (GGDEF)-like protein n=1 Tax=Orenia marismortui TaxID=46469 RepID=A0A4R8H194_9FIRM|nr:bifunctional diguanylate cyclase/phosphodiesterase [Orenia marismortui]TDX53204.1 PAS domain S-box-containing protein/diguanylate cyclase (GGDEF)-like protein [Orenia marismortui]
MKKDKKFRSISNMRECILFLRQENMTYRDLIASIPQPILIHQKKKILYANKLALDTLGVKSLEDIICRSIFDFISVDYNQVLMDRINEVYDDGDLDWHEIEIDRADGNKALVELACQIANISGDEVVITVFKDITARKEIEKSIKENKERFQSLFEYNPDSVFASDSDGRFISVNSASQKLTGYNEEELLKMSFEDLVLEDECKKVWGYYQKALNGEAQSFKCSILNKENQSLDLSVKVFPMKANNELVGVYGIAKDITEEKRMKDKIEYIANHDQLTRLPNRYYIYNYIEELISKAEIKNFSILFIDLDRFKLINDTLGHNTGDIFLQQVAKRLKSSVRKKDIVARLGGDEFIILMEEESKDVIKKVSQRIIDKISYPFMVGGNSIATSASIGISIYPDGGADLEDLLKHADIAMYEAKKRVGGNYKFYNSEIEKRYYNKIELENDLKKAIRNDELFMIYQPQFDLSTEKLTGIEALIRWEHPRKGMISPVEFIPIAEETGLIVPMGKWILRTVCEQNKRWQDAGFDPIRVAVNVSIRQLQEDDFVDSVKEVIEETSLEPEFLEIEITENIMRNVSDLNHKLIALKEIGVTVSIDDFGTGYSSLNIISDLPIDSIKIDKSFIDGLVTKAKKQVLAKTIINMGHNLNFSIIAEGIETREQLSFLRNNSCNIGQGYLFSKPVSAKEVEEYFLN